MNIHPAHAPFSVPAISPIEQQLHVVTCISNPARYHSRYRLYRAFAKHMQESGVQLLTVESAFGERPFEVTTAGNPADIQVRTSHELWHKENLLNLGIARLPASARYIAVIDADFIFARPDWAQETIQQLQHHDVVQLFTDVHYQGPNGVVLKQNRSFVSRWQSGEILQMGASQVQRSLVFAGGSEPQPAPAASAPGYPEPYATGLTGSRRNGGWGAPGGAWAFRRSALDALGGLIDFSILGSADYFMAAALIGELEAVLPRGYSDGFKDALRQWQSRAERCIRRNVGLVEGSVFHPWHGKFSDRGYQLREQIHYRHQFDPARDLKRDSQGLYQLHDDGTPRFVQLRDEIRAYFRARNEDSIDV